jgi:hypothetical protein
MEVVLEFLRLALALVGCFCFLVFALGVCIKVAREQWLKAETNEMLARASKRRNGWI